MKPIFYHLCNCNISLWPLITSLWCFCWLRSFSSMGWQVSFFFPDYLLFPAFVCFYRKHFLTLQLQRQLSTPSSNTLRHCFSHWASTVWFHAHYYVGIKFHDRWTIKFLNIMYWPIHLCSIFALPFLGFLYCVHTTTGGFWRLVSQKETRWSSELQCIKCT